MFKPESYKIPDQKLIYSQGSAIRSPPTRKPTGPRPLTSGGPYSPSNIKRTRYRGSPMQIDYEDEY